MVARKSNNSNKNTLEEGKNNNNNNNINKNNQQITLYHQSEKNRHLEIRLEEHTTVAAPLFTNDKWSFPCQLIGIEGKKMKNVKIRLHPEAMKLASGDEDLTAQLRKTAEEMAVSILGVEGWSLTPLNQKDLDRETIKRLRALFTAILPVIECSSDSLEFVFPFVNPESDKNNRKRIENGMEALGKGKELKCNIVKQENGLCVQLCFERDGDSANLWMAEIESLQYIDTTRAGLIEISQQSIRMRLPRAEASVCEDWTAFGTPHIQSFYTFDEMGNAQLKKMQTVQDVVEDLRRKIEQEMLAYTARSESHRGKGRKIMVVDRNHNEGIFSFGDEANPIQRIQPPTSLPPLAVAVDVPFSPSSNSPTSQQLSSSPTDSIDSGVGSSPASSPKLAPLSPFYSQLGYRAGVRQRSYSEQCPGLKGILKWPQPRSTFTRTVSDARSDERDIRRFSLSPALDGIQEQPMRVERKKRVSFSEVVDTRTFRKGSCIEAQKRRAEKSRLRKQRKLSNDMNSESDQNEEFDGVNGEELSESLEELSLGKPGLRIDNRQDSGFCEDEETTKEDNEKNWMRMVRSQRQRWSSESSSI